MGASEGSRPWATTEPLKRSPDRLLRGLSRSRSSLGSVVTDVALAGLRFSIERLAPERVTRWHGHDAHRLCILHRGLVGEDRRARGEDYGRGDLIYRPADVRHRNRYGPRGALVVRVEIEPSGLEALDLGRALLTPRTLRWPAAATLGRRMFEELSHPDVGSRLVLQGITLELLAELARARRRADRERPRWLERVTERLREDFRKPLRLSDLAAEAGVHPAHLAKRFRALHGASVGEFLRRARIDFAARELRETERPLADVAREAGFSDQSHFTKVFRRLTGRTPGEYRARSRSGTLDAYNKA